MWTEACTTLMRLHAEGTGGSVTEALAAAHRLLEELGQELDGTVSDASMVPRELTASLHCMVAQHGLQHVRAAQRAIGEPHPTLNQMFHAVVQWKVKGYDQ